jgi:hypothetical protein
VLNHEQLKIFQTIIKQLVGLRALQETFKSDKTFLIKYFTHYFQSQGKNVLLIETIGVATL